MKLRIAAAFLAGAAGCLLVIFSIFAVWLYREVNDTDRYVLTVAPLSSNPAIQSSVADLVTDQIMDQVDPERRAREALPAEAGFLSPVLSAELREFIHGAAVKVVTSPQFDRLWQEANRAAHAQMIDIIYGRHGAVSSTQGEVAVNLQALAEPVKQSLGPGVSGVLNRILPQDQPVNYVLFKSETLAHIQWWARLLKNLAIALPIEAALFLAAAVILSRHRRVALIKTGLGLAGIIIMVLVLMSAARIYYLDSMQGTGVSDEAAAAFFDIIFQSPRRQLWLFASAGLGLSLAAFFAGHLHWLRQGADRLRNRL